MNSFELKRLGVAIRNQRVALGWSQEELADKAGFHRTYIGMVERGERNASYMNLLKLSEALKLPLPELLSFLL
jgi:transcriptional regulator with XRE-family HTH domain